MTAYGTSGRPAGWVSIEGVNGVGKTHLGRLAAAELGEDCAPVVELPDAPPPLLPGRVIAALRAEEDDLFLRTGHPGTETLLLAGLQVHRYEAAPARWGQTVLEDRGPHSVAVYQAAIITASSPAAADPAVADRIGLRTARQILATIAGWRPLPDITLLVTDDPQRCLTRFETRIGRTATNSERDLMTRVDRLYQLWADADPHVFHLLDRRHISERDLVAAIVSACRRARKEASCHR